MGFLKKKKKKLHKLLLTLQLWFFLFLVSMSNLFIHVVFTKYRRRMELM